jgi:urease accessory protein UreH
MRVSLAEVGSCGRLDLSFALQDGRTILRDSYCEVPFKITRVLESRRPLAHLILMQCTAGLFGGDDVTASIRVERGAQVCITQQSSTKVHPSQDRLAIQHNDVFVAAQGELQLHMEPIIPFANSRLQQTTGIDIEAGGRLSFWEGFMTGRVGRGESWSFHEFASETRLRVAGRLVYLDRFRLRPDQLRDSAWAIGDASYVGTGLYVGNQATSVANRLHTLLPTVGVDTLAPDIAVVRVVSKNGPDFHRCREVFCRESRPLPTVTAPA